MNDTIKKGAMGVLLLAAFALGGAAVAGAVQKTNGAAATTTTATTQGQVPQRGHGRGHHGPGGRRSDETALTGDVATKVRAAVLGKVPGATVERLETDADGNAAYEAHVASPEPLVAGGSRKGPAGRALPYCRGL